MARAPLIDFEGKRVLVTGATSGIGRAVAVELSRQGAKLIVMGRDEEKLKATVKLIESPDCMSVPLDLRDLALILPKVKEIHSSIGRLYGLCHCAGIVETRPLASSKIEGLKEMMDVNLTAGLELAKSVSRRDIMEEEGGSILFISSIYGVVGMPGQIGYCATKGAVIAAARGMAAELARRKIRVNAISPGLVKTEMTAKSLALLSREQAKTLEESYPLGTGQPEDVARGAVFLLAPQSKWITGINLIIDGGYTAV